MLTMLQGKYDHDVTTTRARVEKTEEITILDLDTALQKHTGRPGIVEGGAPQFWQV